MAILAEPPPAHAHLHGVPGDPGPPLLNRNLALLTGSWVTDLSYYFRYGEVSWARSLGRSIVGATGPEAVGAVLTNPDKAFANGPGWEFFIGPFFQRGLMLLDFGEHHRDRHIMQTAFTRPRLEAYLAAINPVITAAVRSWGGRTTFRLYPAAKDLGLEIATRTFMGEEPGAEAARVMSAFKDCVVAGTSVLRRPVPGTRWSRGLASRRALENYLAPRIREARRRDGDDLLHALCSARADDGSGFSDRAVMDHMLFLIMAAHDTSTLTMSTMAYFLAKHPDWQERCRAESAGISRRELTYADLESLASLDLVMKESMRLVSPVPALARMAVKDTDLRGHFVPAGTLVSVSVQLTHLLPSIWDKPEVFDPERFAAPRREDQRRRYAYLPFGGGVHKCIGMHFGGMEVKSVLHQMLLDCRWSVPPAYVMPLDRRSLPRPKDGLLLRLRSL